MAKGSKKTVRQALDRLTADDRKNPFEKYRGFKHDVSAPQAPMVRYETSRFGYTACKYILPAAIVLAYVSVMMYYFSINVTGLRAFTSPFQIPCLILIIPVLILTAPLGHIIVCEQGMFLTKGFSKVFIPWKYLRSYHESQYARQWMILITYYVSRKKHKRVFAITNLATEHTIVEIMNFIHDVRKERIEKQADGSEKEPPEFFVVDTTSP